MLVTHSSAGFHTNVKWLHLHKDPLRKIHSRAGYASDSCLEISFQISEILVETFWSRMCSMQNTSVPKCTVCGAPSKWFCAYCQSSFFCKEHACNHLARQYPDEFGIKAGPREQQLQDEQRTKRFILITIALVLLFLLLCWIWSRPSSGSWETRIPISNTSGAVC